MKLWILRHARAESRSASGSDQDRELAAAGWRACRHLKRWIRDQGVALPDRILVSPARRTRQTAEAVFDGLGGVTPELHDALWMATTSTLVRLIQSHLARDGNDLVLVGHNPGLEDLAVQLGAELPVVGLKPGTLVILEVDPSLTPDGSSMIHLVEANELV